MTAPRPRPAPTAPSRSASVPWGPGVVVVLAVLAVAVGWFVLFDAWWLNSDGSSYLSVGKSFVDGHGFQLPDGDALAWWDRPAYPVLITAPWFVRESLEASIWMSRIPLILVAPIVAAATLQLTPVARRGRDRRRRRDRAAVDAARRRLEPRARRPDRRWRSSPACSRRRSR